MSLKFPISFIGKRIASWLGFGSASRELDGVEDYINLGDILDDVFAGAGKKFTVAAWIKYDTPPGGLGHAIISKDDVGESGVGRQWNFSVFDDGVNSDGAIRVVIASADNTKRRIFDTDSGYINGVDWYHVAFTYDQTKNDDELVTIYVNGEPRDASITSTAGSNLSIEDTPSPVVIGFFDPAAISPWYGKGKIADVRIYDTDIGLTKIIRLSEGQDIQNNLVGHWLKDTDDVIDHSINSNDGDNGFEPDFSTDAPPVSYGSSGGASRDFNGLDDIIPIADNSIFSFGDGSNDSPFSAAAWIKMNDSDRFRVLNKYGTASNEFLFTTTDTREFTLALYDQNAVGGVASQQRRYTVESMDNYVGVWTHVAGTYDGRGGSAAHEGIKLYINGSEVATVVQNFNGANYVAIEDTTSYLTIGGDNGSARRADGKIADVRLYDDVLTSGEVSGLYNGTDHSGNLIGHWIGDADDFLDMSVNSNNGIVDGSTYSLDGPKP